MDESKDTISETISEKFDRIGVEDYHRKLFRRCLDLADAAGGDPVFAQQTASILYADVLARSKLSRGFYE